MKLSENGIRCFLQSDPHLRFKLFDTIPSTNTFLKAEAEQGAEEGLIAVAENQSAGKGRMGRAFASPNGSGIYMSMLIRPSEAVSDATLITACAAVAVSDAIENVTGIPVGIKWVNDLFYSSKKVCGILAEGVFNAEKASYDYIVLGIGINLIDTFKGTELKDIAGGLYSHLDEEELILLRHKLIAEVINCFFGYYVKGLSSVRSELLYKYRSRLFLIGKDVDVISYTDEQKADVVALNDDFSLRVRFTDGSVKDLNSGEVRLRISNAK